MQEPASSGHDYRWVLRYSTIAGKGEGKPIVPMWSDRAYARQCAKQAWAKCTPHEYPLEEYMTAILPNMHKAKVLVGTNWNAHLLGHEIAPKKLLAELTAAIRK
jgi:hypothetical protein